MNNKSLRETLNTIIFGTDTPAGRGFDLALIWAILISVARASRLSAVMDSRLRGNGM